MVCCMDCTYTGNKARRCALPARSTQIKDEFDRGRKEYVTMQNLQELFIHELKDLYSAEQQLIQALPKMAKAASTPELKKGFEMHLDQTKEHAQRIEQIFEDFDRKPGGIKC